jgi:hypothetical protein
MGSVGLFIGERLFGKKERQFGHWGVDVEYAK